MYIIIPITVYISWAAPCDTVNFDTKDIADSGRFVNDLGDYQDCLLQPQSHYLTAYIQNNIIGGMYYGLCAPLDCTPQELNANISKTLAQDLDAFFKSILNTNQTVVPLVFFTDPVENKQEVTVSRGIVIGILSSLFLVTIIASFLTSYLSQGKAKKIARCFSFKDNFIKIMNTKEPENANLTFINGVRVLSVLWIVFAHGNWLRIMIARNWVSEIDILQTAGIPTLSCTAYYGVDVFFWVGGFLLTIGLLQKINPHKFGKNYVGLILHRLLRIWPTYIAAILFFWKVMPVMGSGPIYSLYSKVVDQCDDGGFLNNMFFIDNFRDHGPNGQKYCFGWGWYLAVDFQLFIITPFLFLLYRKSKKIGLAVLIALFVASVLSAWLLVFINEWRYPTYNPTYKPQPKFMDNFYYKPWIRAAPYLMGIFSGLFYLQWKEKSPKVVNFVNYMKNSIRFRIGLYAVGVTLTSMVIILIIPYQTNKVVWSNTAQAFYNSFNRVAFVLGLILVTLPCMFGCRNDPCHIILGAKLFYPLAKIQFGIYLMHLTLIMMRNASSMALPYWQQHTALMWSISDVVYSIVFGLLLSMVVEAPVLNLQKLTQNTKKPRPQKQESIEQALQETPKEEKRLQNTQSRIQ